MTNSARFGASFGRGSKSNQVGALALVVGLGVVACSGSGAEDDLVEVSGAITGGVLGPSANPPWTSVVKLGGCSGLKLDAFWYLTAAHCGFTTGSVNVTNSLDGGGSFAQTITVARQHPTSLNVPSTSTYHDLALLKFATTNAIPAVNPTFVVQPTPSAVETVISMGYGCDLVTPSNGGNKQWQFFPIEASVPASSGLPFPDAYFFGLSGVSPQTCPGDSGGPVFNSTTGTLPISGVNSGWWNGGGGGSIFARVSPAVDWIASVRAGKAGKNDYTAGNVGTLVNRQSNWCLRGDGSAATQTACGMSDNPQQRYKIVNAGSGFVRFQNNSTGACLKVSLADNQTIINALCSDTSAQWQVSGTGDYRQIKNKLFTGKCMRAVSTSHGAAIKQATCATTQDFYWMFSD